MAGDGQYDPRSALYRYASILQMTRELEAALVTQYAANGFTPLTEQQVLAITGPLPQAPTGMKRFADSNPDPVDGWALDMVQP